MKIDNNIPDINQQEIIDFQQKKLDELKKENKRLSEEYQLLHNEVVNLRKEKTFRDHGIKELIPLDNDEIDLGTSNYMYLDYEDKIHLVFEGWYDVTISNYVDCSIRKEGK